MNSIRIVVLKGLDAGHSVVVDRPLFVIGSGRAATLRLNDDSVESKHLQLLVQADGIRIRDLSSAGGISVGSVKVRDAILIDSTKIVIGGTTLLIEITKHGSVSIASEAGKSREVVNPSSQFDLAHLPYHQARALAIERFERAYIPTVLATSNNVVTHAARRAGVGRESFHRILKRVRDTAKRAAPVIAAE